MYILEPYLWPTTNGSTHKTADPPTCNKPSVYPVHTFCLTCNIVHLKNWVRYQPYHQLLTSETAAKSLVSLFLTSQWERFESYMQAFQIKATSCGIEIIKFPGLVNVDCLHLYKASKSCLASSPGSQIVSCTSSMCYIPSRNYSPLS